MKPVAYGVDFGTTNSAISIAWSDGTTSIVGVGADGAPIIPSILYLDQTGNRTVGDLAVRTHLVNGVGRGRLMSSIKSWLTDESFTTTEAPNGRHFKMEDLVGAIIQHLKRAADSAAGEPCGRAVIGRPVVFAGASGDAFERQTKLAKDRLIKAAKKAGFEEVVLLDESTAAVQGETTSSGIVVAVDFGGGTFDVSVVEATPSQWTVLATHGVAVGGEYFDGLVFDACAAPALGLDREYVEMGKALPVPHSIGRMRTLSGTLRVMREQSSYAALEKWGDRVPVAKDILMGGHGYAFYRAVESTKIDLSSVETATLSFTRPGINVRSSMRREKFEQGLQPSLEKVARTIDRALQSAEVQADDVTTVVRTGGSSSIPAFVRLLEERFGPERVAERDAFATVALGLGIHSQSIWG